MNAINLAQSEIDLIRGVLERYPVVTGAILFGSRANGTATPSSDIDLALEGITDALETEAIATELEELPLPYHFDVRTLTNINSVPLREHIARVGVRIYG